MIAVHINTQHDTDIMSRLFDNLSENPDNIVLVNPKRSELEDILRSRPNDTCMFLGHGSGRGLFRADDDCEPFDNVVDYDDYYEYMYEDEFKENDTDSLSRWSPYIIDEDNVHLLKDREVIGIWCYASDFATRYNLRGFFTYMFVSNPMEARFLSFGEHTTEEVDEQNIHFCKQINNLIKEGVEPKDYIEKLEYDNSINFVNFNYSNMIYNYGY